MTGYSCLHFKNAAKNISKDELVDFFGEYGDVVLLFACI